jgi:hypothetical protein
MYEYSPANAKKLYQRGRQTTLFEDDFDEVAYAQFSFLTYKFHLMPEPTQTFRVGSRSRILLNERSFSIMR